MGYNYNKERKKWTKWKEQEEQLLRSLNVDETIIMQLHQYDWDAFKTERRIRRKQNATTDSFFYNIPCYDQKDILTVEDLLDEIENEALFNYLSQSDQITLTIILMKMLGYSVKDISKILKISSASIYQRTHRLKNNLKKFTNDVKNQ